MIFAEAETGSGERRGTGAGGPPPGVPPRQAPHGTVDDRGPRRHGGGL